MGFIFETQSGIAWGLKRVRKPPYVIRPPKQALHLFFSRPLHKFIKRRVSFILKYILAYYATCICSLSDNTIVLLIYIESNNVAYKVESDVTQPKVQTN
jgi:hypothetical protein